MTMSDEASDLLTSPTARRIRDAAITTIAEVGPGAATVRRIAARAGVSPALVIHHFGSMAALRRACDRFVAERIRETKAAVLGGDPRAAVVGIVGEDDRPLPVASYLARVLHEDTEEVAALVDALVDDARTYLAEGERAGTVRPTDDAQARAAVLTIWSLGALALHHHLERLLDVDLLRADGDPRSAGRYLSAANRILSEGVLDPTYAEDLDRVLRSDRDHTEERRHPAGRNGP